MCAAGARTDLRVSNPGQGPGPSRTSSWTPCQPGFFSCDWPDVCPSYVLRGSSGVRDNEAGLKALSRKDRSSVQHCLGKKAWSAKLGLQIGATVVVKWQLLQSCCTSPRSSPQMVGSLIHVVNTNNGPSLEENLFDHLPHVRNTDVPRMGAAARGIRSRCIRVVMRAQLAPWSLLRTCEQSAMKK